MNMPFCVAFQDSKRFEGIDVDFKELAYEAQKTPNVIEATNKPGLSQQLEDVQSRQVELWSQVFVRDWDQL